MTNKDKLKELRLELLAAAAAYVAADADYTACVAANAAAAYDSAVADYTAYTTYVAAEIAVNNYHPAFADGLTTYKEQVKKLRQALKEVDNDK